jgi:phospholipid/cholesterol/gamma-HCH transport system permease protein
VTTSTQESPAGAAMTAQPPAAVPNPIAAAFDRAPKAVASVGMRPVNAIGTVGRAARLLVEVLRFSITDALSGRLPVGELVNQAWLLYKVTALPAVLMAIPFGGMVAVQISGLINQVGANSLVGAASGVGIVRQGAPITAGLLMGGAAASAIASDLGARAIRDELDALRVMGVDPVRHLIVPRFLALIVLAPILCAVIIASSVVASFLLSLNVSDVAPGTYWSSFGAFAKMVDVWFAIAKAVVFGAIVGIVSSLRGMEAKGGPRGVADAVSASVVLNVTGILFANLVITQLETMFFPMRVA